MTIQLNDNSQIQPGDRLVGSKEVLVREILDRGIVGIELSGYGIKPLRFFSFDLCKRKFKTIER